MDFPAAPCIRRAVEKRAAHGVFGYSSIPEAWYNAYRNWWGTHHGLNMERKDLLFVTGVIPALSSAIREFTSPGDKIIIQTPVYNHFFTCISSNGRQVLGNPLIYRDGKYEMDFEDLENKLSDPQAAMLVLCNPQNPVGKIWSREELARIGELCKKYQVTVFSDEIHCDLTAPGKGYVPFASVDETCRMNSITALAPTKAFNIAGMHSAAAFVPEESLRQRMDRGNFRPVCIGDRFSDVEAGRKNGLPVVGCLYGYGSPEELRECSVLIRDIAELPAALETIST